MAIKDRINHIIQEYALTPSKFADIIGVQRSNISHILSGRNKPSLDFILKVLEHFPEVNSDWLIKGDGEELQKNVEQESLTQLPFEDKITEPTKTETTQGVNSSRIEKSPSVVQEEGENDKDKGLKMPFTSTNTQKDNTISSNSNKRIKRIIVFYDDNSFEEFTSN